MDGTTSPLRTSFHRIILMGMTPKGSFFKGGVDCSGVETMNKPWVFDQLEDLMFLLCGLEKPQPEDAVDADDAYADEDDSPGGDSGYEPTEKELELLRKLTAIVLDGPNVNKGALKEFEKKYPWVSCLICACHCLSGFSRLCSSCIQWQLCSSWQATLATSFVAASGCASK